MPEWREREVTNETDSRVINEIADADLDHFTPDLTDDFVCECSDGECTATVAMTPAEYEEVRVDGATFMLARHHESPEIDMLMTEGPRFSIVRKLPGFAARQATALDPRRRVIEASAIL